MQSAGIDIRVLAEIVVQTGAMVDSLQSIGYKMEEHEKQLVGIGVMEFPQPGQSYIKACIWRTNLGTLLY